MAQREVKKQQRTKIPVRREISAGGLVWRRRPEQGLEFVLVRPRGSDTWAMPKGHLEKGESIEAAAVREVREETGLSVGRIEPLGDVSYIFSSRDSPGAPLTRISKRVHFFLMEFTGGDHADHDSEIDEVAWLSASEAFNRATYGDECKLIEKAIDILSPNDAA
ncbi:MAG TPA: NUDIX hydrolase [Candidatus Binataceae bacterium]|nr:NUDIX hydrolase [Candidatus Binataceae bacterium]